jgi:hypothetical protein
MIGIGIPALVLVAVVVVGLFALIYWLLGKSGDDESK